ncbi:hypothetical protein IW261DRAFT_1570390 [Armillaria novae-zelandiae]|uniref:Uncharacterized protein n=1 Tax=Armillaria novae-zelandiae TaxID=153914 RepID=A0AA39NVW6_9AGAR|nr:hypothetical protein IW261DRAFT_1570390 [Armillaria novae-zelandiae]
MSNISPPLYIATNPPPLYSAVDTLVNEDIHAVDIVEPAPVYDEYTPLQDIRMAGFTCSELATVLEEELK